MTKIIKPSLYVDTSGFESYNLDAELKDDAAAGSFGTEWDFLVDGLVSPSGITFELNGTIAPTVHSAEINSSGEIVFDIERGASNGYVKILKSITGLAPLQDWPQFMFSCNSYFQEISGTWAGEIDFDFVDEDATGTKDVIGWDMLSSNTHRLVTRLDNESSASTTGSGSKAYKNVADNHLQYNMRPGFGVIKSSVGTGTGKPAAVTQNYLGNRWFSRRDFSSTDSLLFALIVTLTGACRVKLTMDDLSFALYKA